MQKNFVISKKSSNFAPKIERHKKSPKNYLTYSRLGLIHKNDNKFTNVNTIK